jgi:hypothetical protein
MEERKGKISVSPLLVVIHKIPIKEEEKLFIDFPVPTSFISLFPAHKSLKVFVNVQIIISRFDFVLTI